MATLVETLINIVSHIVEVLAAAVVGYGVVSAFYRVAIRPIRYGYEPGEYARARIDLGRLLTVGLEFELGADLLQTAIAPTWNHIGIVAAIVVLRSVLNFVLERDIERLEQRVDRSGVQHEGSQPRTAVDEKGG